MVNGDVSFWTFCPIGNVPNRTKCPIWDTSLNKCKQGTLFFLVFLYKILYNFFTVKNAVLVKAINIAFVRERATMEVFEGKV